MSTIDDLKRTAANVHRLRAELDRLRILIQRAEDEQIRPGVIMAALVDPRTGRHALTEERVRQIRRAPRIEETKEIKA